MLQIHLRKQALAHSILGGVSHLCWAQPMWQPGTLTSGVANALPNNTALSVNGTIDLAGFALQVASVDG